MSNMIWRHDQGRLIFAGRNTDRFLASQPVLSKEIETASWVLHSLLDLIPMTVQNAFSGNLSPILEADQELRASNTLAWQGLYKQALVSLRSVLELGMLSVYWDAEDQAHTDIQDWRRGTEWTPGFNKIKNRLKYVDGIREYLREDPELFDRVEGALKELGMYVHTRGHQGMSAGIAPFTDTGNFHEDAFRSWAARVVQIVQLVLALHLMKYPVGLQITNLSDKFGLDAPAGGFIEPSARDRYRDFLHPEMRDALQVISDNDQDAQAARDWVMNRPDLSEVELREQCIRHDQQTIRMSGFESWSNFHDTMHKHGVEKGVPLDEGYPEHREEMRRWAEQEGILTLEEVIQRRTLDEQARQSMD